MGKLTITRCTHTSATLCNKCRLFNALESLRCRLDAWHERNETMPMRSFKTPDSWRKLAQMDLFK